MNDIRIFPCIGNREILTDVIGKAREGYFS